MKSNGFTLFNRLLLTFDYRMQESHPAFAPLIKYLETALVRYYEDKSTIDPNWVEWIVATNNSLPARESKGYSIKSIEFVHQLLRKQLANYDKNVKDKMEFCVFSGGTIVTPFLYFVISIIILLLIILYYLVKKNDDYSYSTNI